MSTKKPTKAAKKPKQPKPKQTYIPELEPPSIPALEAAAEEFVEADREKKSAAKEAKAAHDRLLGVMAKEGLNSYEFDGYLVRLDTKKCAKVKRKKQPKEDGEE